MRVLDRKPPWCWQGSTFSELPPFLTLPMSSKLLFWHDQLGLVVCSVCYSGKVAEPWKTENLSTFTAALLPHAGCTQHL